MEVGQRAGKRGGGDTHLISGVYALARCLVATGGWFAMSARMPATMRDALAFINREYNREQVSAGRTLVRWEGGAVLLLMKCLLEAYLTGFGFLHADAPEGLPHWEEAAAKAAAASLAKMGDLRDDNAHVYEARALAAGGDVSSLPPDVALAFQFQSHGVSPGVVRQALMLVLCRINKSLSTHWSHRHREPGADSKRLAYDRAWLETAVRWCQEVPDSHWASWCLAEGAASLYGPGHISQRFMHAALERAQAAGDDLTAALAAWNLALCTVFSTPDEPRTFSPAAVGRLTAAAEGYEGACARVLV